MRNIILKMAMLGITTSVAVNSFAAETVKSNILLKGSIYNATCSVEVNGQAATNNPVVNMGTWPSSAFNGVGSQVGGTASDGKISIDAVDCPENGTMRVNITAATDPTDNTLVKLDSSGATDATGVAIALYEGDKDGNKTNNKIQFAKDYEFDSHALEGITKVFYGVYQATAEKVSAGNANATVHATMTYN